MLRSMTGFGRAEGPVGEGVATIELRSVNNRSLDVKVNVPRTLLALQPRFVDAIRVRVFRGRVDLYLTQAVPIGQQSVRIDHALLDRYVAQAREIRERVPESGPLDVTRLLQLPGVVSTAEPSVDDEALWGGLSPVLESALEALVASKRSEGERLEKDFRERLATIGGCVEPVAACKDQVVADYRERLTQRLVEFVGAGDVDENRLAHEVALFADRCDITEEIVRLRSHLEAFGALLDRYEAAPYASLGKETDFLLQEMFRETNTIGNKANSLDVTQHVLRIKGEIEKLREQAQNVE